MRQRIFHNIRNYIRPLITVLALTVLTFSCNDNRKNISHNATTADSSNIQTKDSFTKKMTTIKTTTGIIYQTENVRLHGDTTIEKEKISYSSLRFEPYIAFEDFKVTRIDNKRHAPINLESNKYANNFRTRLRDAYAADTANFGGHYTFVTWGCGASCQSSMLIDRQTGKIYESPEASCGYEFRVNSRMLIVNPPDTSGFYDDIFDYKPAIYIFYEQTKTFNERQPK